VCPVLVLPECAAAVARPTGELWLAEEVLALIQSLPGINLASVDFPLARRAADIAALHRLRGADSIYVAVAEAHGATLVTWDTEMLDRAPAVVKTMTPTAWLAQLRAKE